MTAAIALAIVLVVVIAGLSLAMQGQKPVQMPGTAPRRAPSPPRRPPRERRVPPQPPAPKPQRSTETPRGPELLRTGMRAPARVISVIDERTLGSITHSRLNLEVKPDGQPSFEVQLRMTFPNPQARSEVRVGRTVPVRFDPDNHRRVVLDPNPAAGPSGRSESGAEGGGSKGTGGAEGTGPNRPPSSEGPSN